MVVCCLIPAIFAASCNGWNNNGTDRHTTTSEESVTSAPEDTASEPDLTQPSQTETTSAPTVTPAQTEPEETTMSLPEADEIDFRVLPANETVQVDLNGDGSNESIHYTCLDEFSFNLTFNGETRRYEGENFLPDYFFLINLDNNTPVLDIAVQEMGPSDDYQVVFYYYDGEQLIRRGSVPGLICDPRSDTIFTDPFGTGTITVDGSGRLQGMARGQILHTWYHPEIWLVGPDDMLRKEHQQFVSMALTDPVELRLDLDLFVDAGSSEIAGTAYTGDKAQLIRTDNQSWVQLRTEDGL